MLPCSPVRGLRGLNAPGMKFSDEAKACWDAIWNAKERYDDVDPFPNLCKDFQGIVLAQVSDDILEKQCDKIRSALGDQYRGLNILSATIIPFDGIRSCVPTLQEQLP
jgi:hypothetical protein